MNKSNRENNGKEGLKGSSLEKQTHDEQEAIKRTHNPEGTAVTMNMESESQQIQTSPYTILALYKFFVWPQSDVNQVQARLEAFLRPRHARGFLLVARLEGLNGTISYRSQYHDDIQNFLRKLCGEDDWNDDLASTAAKETQYKRLRFCVSHSSTHVFHRLKIKAKQEIVSMGLPFRQIVPDFCPGNQESAAESACEGSRCSDVGIYVPPGEAWHAVLQDPQCLVIDTRNEYEVALGTFENAVNPHTTSFTEFPEWFQKHVVQGHEAAANQKGTSNHAQSSAGKKNGQSNDSAGSAISMEAPLGTFNKVAMFCTGGIRCEKASAYCLANLPKDVPVYHLEGGILAYLNQVPPAESQWHGECYVFDQRIAVTHQLEASQTYTTSCHACRHPLSREDLASDYYCPGVACPYCMDDDSKEQRRHRYRARQAQIHLAQVRGCAHIHDPKEMLTEPAPCPANSLLSS